MLHKALGVIMLTLGALGCRDGPTAPRAVPSDVAPATALSTEALTAINELGNDPLVQWLVETVPHSDAARELQAIFSAYTDESTRAVPWSDLPEADEMDHELYQAALVVLLDEVHARLGTR